MSPHVANRFSGHFPEGDPRTPLHAAAGNTWPTVPAYRFYLISDNATGTASFWNHATGVIEQEGPFHEHSDCYWSFVAQHPAADWFVLRKLWIAPQDFYTWQLAFQVTAGSQIFGKIWTSTFGPGNVDLAIGSILPVLPGPPGDTGSTFRALQLEWNGAVPP